MLALISIVVLLAGCGKGKELPPLPATGTVVAFGDSLTFGTGASGEQSYPTILQGLISREVINAGVPGEKTGDGVQRLSLLLAMFQPKLLILCHGFDELQNQGDYDQVARNVRAMVDIAKSRGVGVVLVAAPKIGVMTAPAMLYGSVALQAEVPFEAGIVSHILNDKSLAPDGTHPNALGYRLLAEQLAKKLKDAGAL